MEDLMDKAEVNRFGKHRSRSAARYQLPGVAIVMALSCAACGAMQNTSQQDYVFETGRVCQANAHGIFVSRVSPDGSQYWLQVNAAGPWEHFVPRFRACMADQFKANPYPDWLEANKAGK